MLDLGPIGGAISPSSFSISPTPPPPFSKHQSFIPNPTQPNPTKPWILASLWTLEIFSRQVPIEVEMFF
jgi:hypothetical protein